MLLVAINHLARTLSCTEHLLCTAFYLCGGNHMAAVIVSFPQQLNKSVISFIYKEYIRSEVPISTYHRKKKLEQTLSFD